MHHVLRYLVYLILIARENLPSSTDRGRISKGTLGTVVQKPLICKVRLSHGGFRSDAAWFHTVVMSTNSAAVWEQLLCCKDSDRQMLDISGNERGLLM
jgi:hypothetical protein